MSTDRIVRINELLRREIGEAVIEMMREAGFDLASVTVTSVFASRDLQHARVLVSIRDHEDERARMLSRIKKHRAEIQSRINRNLSLHRTPRLLFELDTSIEKGARMLNLLNRMEEESGGADTDVEPAES